MPNSLRASSFCELIEARADVSDEITYAFSSRPTNIMKVVAIDSKGVNGKMSKGIVEVTIPAPQKNEKAYLAPRFSSFFSQTGGCHVFSTPAYQWCMRSGSESSRSETSHQRQPNQWQHRRAAADKLVTASTPGFTNSSKLAKYFLSLAMRASLASFVSRNSRSNRLARAALPAASSVAATSTLP